MFGGLARRALSSVIGVYALLGFCFVPLGSKTGLEHTVGVLRSQPARDATEGLISAAQRAQRLVTEAFMGAAKEREPLPLPSGSSAVRPVPPRLR